jgi:hypothetical protein
MTTTSSPATGGPGIEPDAGRVDAHFRAMIAARQVQG